MHPYNRTCSRILKSKHSQLFVREQEMEDVMMDNATPDRRVTLLSDPKSGANTASTALDKNKRRNIEQEIEFFIP